MGADADAVAGLVENLLADPAARTAMVEAGLQLVDEGRGAVGRTLQVIAADLPAG